jgi:hypothetical protein
MPELVCAAKEPLIKSVIVMPAKAGIQESSLKPLDSGFRRNAEKGEGVLVQSFPNMKIACDKNRVRTI